MPRAAKQRQKPTPTRQAITLKGSTKLVTEFFKYAANTYVSSNSPTSCAAQSLASRILFQRGVYPSDDFQMVKKYGQTVLITQDAALEAYLDKFVFTRSASPSVFINDDIGY
jgi:mitotic spindle assembly checkpoint protein MAD2